jgi:nitric oxide reductase NorQ protein
MAHKLNLALITVSCHEDLTAGDLVGRYIFKGNETIWEDGPLTLAVKYGGICYLDEIVEARNDTTVIIHSLTDDRRILYLDKTQEVIRAHRDFMMVLSYNPGYQNIMKDLKQSTKQRFMSLIFPHPELKKEIEIIHTETSLDKKLSEKLATLGAKIRHLKDYGLSEGVSSRLLVYAGRLIKGGVPPREACRVAVAHSLTDEEHMIQSVMDVVNLFFPEKKDEKR